MTTPEERMAVQTRMLVDEIKSQNASDHVAIRHELSSQGESIVRIVGEHTKKWAVGAAFVGFVGLALPLYGQIQQALATPRVIETAREATRQEFQRLRDERSVELAIMAKQAAQEAAQEAVKLVFPSQDIIKGTK